MASVNVNLPTEFVAVANRDEGDVSTDTPLAEFMDFVVSHGDSATSSSAGPLVRLLRASLNLLSPVQLPQAPTGLHVAHISGLLI